MKKIIVFIIFIVSAVCAYSQNHSNVSTPADEQTSISSHRPEQVASLLKNDAYKNTPEWGKYEALRTVGWTTFGVGMTATCVGGYLYLLLANLSGNGEAGAIVFFSGLGVTAASVPILISAYHYRSKAKKIGLSMGVTQLSAPTFDQNLSYTPAMNFTITF